MKYFLCLLLLGCLVLGATGTAVAQGGPIQLALFPPVQIVPENESVTAFRFALIYGVNANMTGFDWGLVTKSTGSVLGVQWALVGLVDQNFTGWQNTAVNIVGGSFEGLQMGWIYSSSSHVSGVQFGLINSTGSMKGFQLGLINLISEGGFMPIFPIVNWGGL